MAPYVKEKALQKKIKKAQKKRLEAKVDDTSDVEATAELSFNFLYPSMSEGTVKAIEEMGFKTMTEIQAKAIPKLLEGRNLQGTAKTGSGKTLAFLIPVVELIVKLRFKPRNGTGAIIISPTREITMQTYGFLRELMRHHSQTFGLVMGGTCRKSEAQKLSKGVNILVATPGRLLDHLEHAPHFNFKNLACLVIDEADRILDFGFGEEMKKIVELVPEYRQTMLFSATKDHRTNQLAQLFLKANPLEVDVQSNRAEATAEGLEQAYLICPLEKRFLVLYTFIKKNYKKKVMVFFSSGTAVKFYNDLLNYINIPVMCIYGKQKPSKRISTFYKFCNVDQGILLCTNVAARGWDIPSVDWIVQYDPPDDPKEYIHRVGRTARAGGKGKALLFLTEAETVFIRYLKAHKVSLVQMDISWSKINEIQDQLEEIVNPNYHLRSTAQEGFQGYVRAYDSHSLKKIFDIEQLDLTKVAKCFCLNKTPYINLKRQHSSQWQKTNDYSNDNFKSWKRLKSY